MRIVAGELRGRKLVAPDGGTTRPTTDKVREAVFNALGSLDVVDGARVADLYAGSGALGIEALSRGAEHCTFVERDRDAAVGDPRQHRRRSASPAAAAVVSGDAAKMGAGLDVDLVFADPPYDFDAWPRPASRAVRCAADRRRGRPTRWRRPTGGSRAAPSATARTWVTFLHRA